MLNMREAGIEPKRLKFIHNTLDAAPKILLISGRRNAGRGLKTEPPLIIRNDKGEFTDDYLKVYKGQNL
jgi:tRNA1(Val) A37 N6-methylase TrmN6